MSSVLPTMSAATVAGSPVTIKGFSDTDSCTRART